jgi:hypothetical protein
MSESSRTPRTQKTQADPLEEYILLAKWEPLDSLNAARNVEFENTPCIEVTGASIREPFFDFATLRKQRRRKTARGYWPSCNVAENKSASAWDGA